MRALLYPLTATLILITATVQAADPAPKTAKPNKVVDYLLDISVTIHAKNASGSGVFVVTKDGQVWVLTCGHLVEHIRSERKSAKGTAIEFADAEIVQVLVEDGRKTGESALYAEVIRYSDADHGEDIALLRLRSKKYKPASGARFYLDDDIPAVGTKLYHCGSLHGDLGANSVTWGIISQHGRLLNDKVFDQTTCPAKPGSSGGAVCLEEDGRYIGMIVRGSGDTFNFTVPIRRMRTWAKRVGVDFIFDDRLEIPSDEKLKAHPIDDDPTNKPGSTKPGDDDDDDMSVRHSGIRSFWLEFDNRDRPTPIGLRPISGRR